MSRVLVVDDNKLLNELLSEMLTNNGFTVESTVAPSNLAGVVAEFKPDFVVSDWSIAGESCTRAVRDAQSTGVPFETIIMSGYPVEDIEDDVRGLEVATILKKPFAIRELVELMRPELAE